MATKKNVPAPVVGAPDTSGSPVQGGDISYSQMVNRLIGMVDRLTDMVISLREKETALHEIIAQQTELIASLSPECQTAMSNYTESSNTSTKKTVVVCVVKPKENSEKP
jgi:hypothetical protein